MKIYFFFLVFPFLFIFPFTNSGDTAVHNRRTLHQPFFPFDSPAAPPSSLSLSSSSYIPFTPPDEQPFFPKIPTPPPPPPTSFPGNIPSVNLPNSPKPKLVSAKLTSTAATLAIFAAIVAAIAIVVFLRVRKRRRYDDRASTPFGNAKTLEQLDVTKTIIQDSNFHKLDSPELRPLPPLNTVGGKGRSENNIRNNNFEEEFKELYYSSSMVTGSGSRPTFVAMPVDYYESERIIGSGSSSCSSSLGSGYPAMSVSLSTSPRASLSSITSSPNSIDHVAIQNASTPPPPPPPPVRPQVEMYMENKENVGTSKPKLKPLHWDKVRASSDRETVWDQIKSSSFKLNEEMIETLFIIKTPKSPTTNRPIPPWPPASQETRVVDPKKSQNIAIILKALHVTIEEVCDALLEGNADMLGTELLESLLKMAPTKEEEWKIKQYKDDNPVKLGPAEKFLKAVLDVPFAFKRIDAMLYVSNFESEVEYLKRSFQTLEVACEELRNSRVFLKLLEAVLKTGNRMNVGTNRGDAHAFKLDTLLKLVDVKGTDGKTTLLHFVIQEIVKSEGVRLSTPNTNDTKCRKLGLQLVANISSELLNVKKAASIDSEVLHSDVTKLSKGILDISQVVKLINTISDRQRFSESMNMFMNTAEEEIIWIQTQESVVFSLVKEVMEYFHGISAKEEAHPFRIFMVVRDFLNVLDRVCKEVGSTNDRIVINSAHKCPVLVNRTLPQGFTGGQESNSLDDESS